MTVKGFSVWHIDQSGHKEFSGGHEDWESATLLADSCLSFSPDVVEEMVADDPRSCYNCRHRRWTMNSFTCTAPVLHQD